MDVSDCFNIVANVRYVLVELLGKISEESVIQASKSLLRNPGYQPGKCVIWDATAADLSDIDSDIVEQAVLEIDRIYKGLPLGHIALVSEKLLNLGTIEVFKEVYDKDIVRVFETLADAEKWVDTLIASGNTKKKSK